MGSNYVKSALIFCCVVFLVEVTISSSPKTSKNIKKHKIRRSSDENMHTAQGFVDSTNVEESHSFGETASKILSYHRSFVPDMSFSSQVEDMPIEEKITIPSSEFSYSTKKDNVPRALNEYINSDLDRLNQLSSSDYSDWSRNQPTPIPTLADTTTTPTNTANRYQGKGSISNNNSIHISQFSCLTIQKIMCMYEQVSILCPLKCQANEKDQSITGNYNNTQLDPLQENGNNAYSNSSQENGNSNNETSTTTATLYPNNSTTFNNTFDPNKNNDNGKNNEQLTYQTGGKLVEVYVNYDESVSVDKVMTNNTYPESENLPVTEAPLNITSPTQLQAFQNNTNDSDDQQKNGNNQSIKPYPGDSRSLTTFDPATSSYIASPSKDYDQLQDILNDSFYILSGAVDRTSKGFYLANFGQINRTKPANETTQPPILPEQNQTTDSSVPPQQNHTDNHKDRAECSRYTVDNCFQGNVSELCPYLCRVCSPWSAVTNCSVTCGGGVQNMSRQCVFPNGTHSLENMTILCNVLPCDSICKVLTPWGPCLKPIDGVSVRVKNCTFLDGSSHIYYEHRACNDNSSIAKPQKRHAPSNLAAYISFDKFRDDINVIYDEQVDNNDLNVLNVKLFDGNFTCGFGALLTQHDSIMIFNDDVFRNFPNETFSIFAWIFPKSHGQKRNRSQTIFQLISNENKFGSHMLELTTDGILEWSHYDIDGKLVFIKKSGLRIKKDRWVHIGLVYEHHPLKTIIYLDSVSSIINNNTNVSPTINTQFSKKNIGVFQAVGNNINLNKPFYGVIDEIFIFDKPVGSKLITETADTCRFRTGRGCPSPLLGFCPNCPSCTTTEVLHKDENFDNEQNTPYTPINPPVIS